jgi:hypothetical protein
MMFLGLVMVTWFGHAQSNSGVPVINGHKFLINDLIVDPFTKSSFRTSTGVGSSRISELPPIQIGDSLIPSPSGDLLFVNMRYQFDLRMKEWASFYAGLDLSGRLGSEPYSLYTNGLNSLVGFDMGWKLVLFENYAHFLSTSAGISNRSATVINLSKWIEGIILGEPSQITERMITLQGTTGLYYAWGINQVLGIQAMAQLSYGDLFEEGKSGAQGEIGGALDLNFSSISKVPLGLSLASGYTFAPDFTVSQYHSTWIHSMKFGFTRSHDFLITLDITTYKAPYIVGILAAQSYESTRVVNYALDIIIYFD